MIGFGSKNRSPHATLNFHIRNLDENFQDEIMMIECEIHLFIINH